MAETKYVPISPNDDNDKSPDPELQIQRPRQRLNNFFVTLPWLLTAILGICTITLATRLTSYPTHQLASDLNSIAPTFPQTLVTFQPEPLAVANLTGPTFKQDTKAFWLALVPKGLGFLDIPNPQHYPDLSAPVIQQQNNNKTVYSTSVTHQLHCLYMIMNSYNDLATGNYVPPPIQVEDPHWHIAHCFDYIRQAIMCAADTALEGQETTFPEGIGGTDGWNVRHVCKRYGDVYAWLEGMRVG